VLREDGADYTALVEAIRGLVTTTKHAADELRLLFVTNLRPEEDPVDLGPAGVLNTAQHYTRREADEMVRAFQDLGLTVEPFFSEMKFFEAIVAGDEPCDDRQRAAAARVAGLSFPPFATCWACPS
jgi:hypothetical protein